MGLLTLELGLALVRARGVAADLDQVQDQGVDLVQGLDRAVGQDLDRVQEVDRDQGLDQGLDQVQDLGLAVDQEVAQVVEVVLEVGVEQQVMLELPQEQEVVQVK